MSLRCITFFCRQPRANPPREFPRCTEATSTRHPPGFIRDKQPSGAPVEWSPPNTRARAARLAASTTPPHATSRRAIHDAWASCRHAATPRPASPRLRYNLGDARFAFPSFLYDARVPTFRVAFPWCTTNVHPWSGLRFGGACVPRPEFRPARELTLRARHTLEKEHIEELLHFSHEPGALIPAKHSCCCCAVCSSRCGLDYRYSSLTAHWPRSAWCIRVNDAAFGLARTQLERFRPLPRLLPLADLLAIRLALSWQPRVDTLCLGATPYASSRGFVT